MHISDTLSTQFIFLHWSLERSSSSTSRRETRYLYFTFEFHNIIILALRIISWNQFLKNKLSGDLEKPGSQVILKKERQRRKAGEAAPELMQEGAKVFRELFFFRHRWLMKRGWRNRWNHMELIRCRRALWLLLYPLDKLFGGGCFQFDGI